MNSNHTKSIYSALFLIALLLGSCGGGGGSTAATTPTTNATAASNALFTDAADPVNVTVTTDTVRAASQIVTTSGATLNATAADGSQFTLVIPANAVTQDTTITMTPISGVTGLPLTNGLVAGVQFAPDGLFLEKEATLTIVPAVTVPVANQTFLGYLGAGNDLHLVSPATPSAAIQMKVGHFSGMLLGNGISADRAALYLKRAADHEARLEQEIARVLSEERKKQLLGVDDGTTADASLPSYLDSYYGLVVRPRVLAASASCANAKLALQTYLGYQRKVALLGVTDKNDPNDADLQTITRAIDATCHALANRYTGTFTTITKPPFVDYSGTWSASGTVTFIRDDAACIAAGRYIANTACYRVEAVSYTDTVNLTDPTGCVISASKAVSLSNPSVAQSNMSIDLGTNVTTGAHTYNLEAGWSQSFPGALSYACPEIPSYTTTFDTSASIVTYPLNSTSTDGTVIQYSYTSPLTNFGHTWNLSAAP